MRQGYRARTTAGDKTICLAFPEGEAYDALLENPATYRAYLDEQIPQHPDFFPVTIANITVSEKQGLKQRRILLKKQRQAYQIHPESMMPYM
jgi:hypothetical protein